MNINAKFIIIVAIILLFSILSPLFTSFEPVYDSHGNVGDETMSLSLAYNAYKNKIPSYGYKANGDLWTQGLMTVPIYFLSYGAFMSKSEPVERIDSARTLSKIYLSLSLFLCLLSVFYLYWKLHKDTFDHLILIVSAICISFVFLYKDTFIFISSFARLDAIGLFFVSLHLLALAIYLIHKNRWSLIFCGITCILSFFSNYFAFSVTGTMMFVLFLYHLASNKTLNSIKDVIISCLISLGSGILLFWNFNFIFLHAGTKSDYNASYGGSFSNMITKLLFLDWTSFTKYFVFYQGLLAIIIAFLLYAGISVAYSLTKKSSGKIEILLWGIVFPILMVILVCAVFGTGRNVYTPMLFTPPLMILLFMVWIVKNNKMIRIITPIVLLVLLIFINNPIQHNNLYHEMNTSRNQHLHSLMEWMDINGVKSAFATDPLFTLLDSNDRKFYFLYDTPKSEYAMFKQFNSHYIITNKLGNEGFLAPLGFPVLKTAMLKSSDDIVYDYPDGSIKLNKVFQSSSSTTYPYSYGGMDSTPFYVYKISYK